MGPTTSRAVEAWAAGLLRRAREDQGWSKAPLAAAAGVPVSTVNRIEAGQRQPSLPTLARLLAAAGCEMRIHLEPYDDHDDDLDSRRARTPADQLDRQQDLRDAE